MSRSYGIVYDKSGTAIAEIRATFARSWVLNEWGTCTFSLAASDPKCREDYLAFGNHLVVISEDDNLPQWGGIIVERSWGDRTVTVKCHEAAWILERRIGKSFVKLSIHPSQFFQELVRQANAWHDTLLRETYVWFGGFIKAEEVRPVPLFDYLKKLSDGSGNDWSVEPVISRGHLTYAANWHDKRGVAVAVPLEEGTPAANIERREPILNEYGGEIANEFFGYGEGATWPNRKTHRAADSASAGEYGWQEEGLAVNSAEQSKVDANTVAELSRRKNPVRMVRLVALNRGGLFQWLRIGNLFPVKLHRAGFLGDKSGWNGIVRILAMGYSDAGTVELSVGVYYG